MSRPLRLAVLLLLVVVPSAPAAVGDLSFLGSYGGTDTDGVKSVAVHPNGVDVYAASAGSDSVSHLRRTGGGLAFAGCVGADPACTSFALLNNAWRVAVSPDGADLYAIAGSSDTVVHLSISPATGALAFVDCIAQTATAPCSGIPGGNNALDEPAGLAVTPDGQSVLVAARTSGALTRFTRGAGGSLTYAGCFAKTNAGGCTATGDDGLTNADAVGVSPDGGRVYVTGETSVLKWFLRSTTTGALTPQSPCFGTLACTSSSPHAFLTPIDVAVPAGGRDVYSASYNGGLDVFQHDATTDALGHSSCLDVSPGGGCADVPSLGGAFGIALSPDGQQAYVVSQTADALTVLSRDAGGGLAFRQCLSNAALAGCTTTAGVLGQARGVAVARDGAFVLTAAALSDKVDLFKRQLAPVCQDVASTGASGADQAVTLPCGDANGDALSYEILDAPDHGTLAAPGADGSATYRPAAGFAGTDTVSFRASDGDVASAPATLTLTVTPAPAAAAGGQVAAPAALDTVRPRPRVASRRIRVDRRGVAKLLVSCPGEPGACRGTATLTYRRTSAGRKAFTAPAARSASVRVRITRTVLRRLRRARRLSVRLRLVAVDAAGNRGTATITLTLLAPRR